MKNNVEMPTKSLICFSHLRWDFVFQRPQHLLSRFAANANVYYFEEPVFDARKDPYLSLSPRSSSLTVIVPHIKAGLPASEVQAALMALLDKFFQNTEMQNWTFWYYTPMALSFTDKYKPKVVVYDCMDELSAFKFAPEELITLERKLMAKADIVFTGGHSLYEAKKQQHSNIYPFPSSIDKAHFGQARKHVQEPADQAAIKGPKIGFYGVIDERFDIELIGNMATLKPEWQIVLIGPVVKIEESILPRNKNIHYLGQKTYAELPGYLSGWDMALIPFQLNESTRFISPTKTPEYLSAGIPVVSTPIRDVVKPYGIKKLVHIGSTCEEFIEAIEAEFAKESNKQWIKEVDEFLKDISWDQTYSTMLKHIQGTLNNNKKISIAS
jgi:glycosyltransferase involved in cell wall biosynthesis